MQTPEQPRVTVVTPTFNRAELLPETIESVLSQTYQDFEYIMIDDGSTDSTRELASTYGDKVIYRYHENQGEAASTNRGWGEANGEYFAMVSSDDPMMADWLEESVAFMDENQDVLVAYPDWNMIDDSSKIVKTRTVYDYRPERLYGWVHCLPGPGALIRKSALSRDYRLRDPELRYVSDLESWFRLALLGRFARIPKILATWRVHEASTSIAEKNTARAKETVAMVRNFYRREDLPAEIDSLYTLALSRAYYLASVFVSGHSLWRACYFYVISRLLVPLDGKDMPAEMKRVSLGPIVRFLGDRRPRLGRT